MSTHSLHGLRIHQNVIFRLSLPDVTEFPFHSPFPCITIPDKRKKANTETVGLGFVV